ncbi:MAG: HK97 gp10 family phage protein [Kiritimatiellae bacterium]|nr:HK97 gp10 family phage protein [Kiritimatiellia bacterium]
MIRIKHRGNFSKLTTYLKDIKQSINIRIIEKYANEGVAALAAATPVASGKTANSWYYEIVNNDGKLKLTFNNSNIQNGVPIAVIIQYGHGTRNGGWVEGRDYINPSIRPVFDKITNEIWREVTRK